MIYQNFNRILYVDVNDSRKNFEIMIYYLKNDKKNIISSKKTFVTSKKKFFSFSKRKNVKLIMFLNWIFILVEKKYWLIELKMIAIEYWLFQTIIHKSSIAQWTLSTNSIEKLSQYLTISYSTRRNESRFYSIVCKSLIKKYFKQ